MVSISTITIKLESLATHTHLLPPSHSSDMLLALNHMLDAALSKVVSFQNRSRSHQIQNLNDRDCIGHWAIWVLRESEKPWAWTQTCMEEGREVERNQNKKQKSHWNALQRVKWLQGLPGMQTLLFMCEIILINIHYFLLQHPKPTLNYQLCKDWPISHISLPRSRWAAAPIISLGLTIINAVLTAST